ncbi:MAG: hypothetical protein Q7V01_03165, partial [Vicinamibacterales bacterium]|nr:hypothetical protein [Vicinamibacterales bacterium]
GSSWHSAGPYLDEVPLPSPNGWELYIVACNDGLKANVVVNGVNQLVVCASDGLSGAFWATSVDVAAGGNPEFLLYRPRRFVF